MAVSKERRQEKKRNFDPEARMTFTEHLAELRNRILYSLASILGFSILCYLVSDYLFWLIEIPFRVEKDGKVLAPWVTLNPLEPVFVKIKLGVVGGVLLSLPVILYQGCAFIFPGLRPSERKAAKILLFGCGFLMISGVAVAYFMVFPFVMPYIIQWAPEGVQQSLRMNETISIFLKGLAAFAVAFQLPLVVLVLVYLDLLSPQTLKDYRRIAIVGIAIVSAIFTPPDPLTMSIMMIPMIGLYELSILVSYLVIRKRDDAPSPNP